MFKKLKDKIAEEVKQSPLKSVQQLASAVVSPSSSSVFEPSSNDHFCIDDEDEENQETPKNSPAKVVGGGGFTTVNLHGQTSTPTPLAATASAQDPASNSLATLETSNRSRRSSISSVASDVSSFFARYEPTSNNFHLQSDLESASEVEDSLNVQLERVSKENLYEAYRKLRMRYNKYKGRFVDLAEHYRRLEKENTKCKTILSDTQDKALRRISELREQCTLEQEAKAHLEEALRSDLEEKDHLIRTLNTKIELLKKGDEIVEPKPEVVKETANLVDLSNSSGGDVQALQEKVENLEAMLEENRSSILEKNGIIERLQNEMESDKNVHWQKMSALTSDLNAAREQIDRLQNTIAAMRKSEEESALSLAENKLTVHKELETRDEQISRYKASVDELLQEKEQLNIKVNRLQTDLSALNGSYSAIDEEKTDLQELSRGKSKAVKLMQEKLISNEKAFNENLNKKEYEINKVMMENSELVKRIEEYERKYGEKQSVIVTGGEEEEKEEGTIDDNEMIRGLKSTIHTLESKLQSSLAGRDQILCRISECENVIEKLKLEKNSILEQKNLEMKSLEELIDNRSKENEELRDRLRSTAQKNKILDDEISSNKEKYEKEIEKLKCDLGSELEKIMLLCSAKDEELLKSSKSVDELDLIKKDLMESQKLVNSLREELSSKTTELESKNVLIIEKDSLVEYQKKLIESVENNMKKMESKVENLNEMQKEKAILEQKLHSEDLLRAEIIEKLKEDKFSVEKELKDAENKIVRLKNDLKSKESLIIEKEKEMDEYVLRLQEVEEQVTEYRTKLSEYSKLDCELSSLRKLVSVVKCLLNNSIGTVDNGRNSNDILLEDELVHKEAKILIEDIKRMKHQLEEKDKFIEGLSSELVELKNIRTSLQSQLTQNLTNSCSKEDILKLLDVNKTLLNVMKVDYNNFVSGTKSELESVLNSFKLLTVKFPLLKSSIAETEELTLKRIEGLNQSNEKENLKVVEKNSSLESEISFLKDRCGKLKDELNVATASYQGELESSRKLLELETNKKKEMENMISELERKNREDSELFTNKRNHLECELRDKNNQLTTLQNGVAALKEKQNSDLQALKDRIDVLEKEILESQTKFRDELNVKNQQVLLSTESEIQKMRDEFEKSLLEEKKIIADLEKKLSDSETSLKHQKEAFVGDVDVMKNFIITEVSSTDSEQNAFIWEKLEPESDWESSEEFNFQDLNDSVLSLQSADLKQFGHEIIRLTKLIKQNINTLSNSKNNLVTLNLEFDTLIRKFGGNIFEPSACLEGNPSEGFSQLFLNVFSKLKVLSSLLQKKEDDITNAKHVLEEKCDSLRKENTELLEEIVDLKERSKVGSVSNAVKMSNAAAMLEATREDYVELQAKHMLKCEEMAKLSQELNELKDSLKTNDACKGELMKLRAENDDLKAKVDSLEDTQNKNLKQMILEFNTKIAEKDEEIQAAELKKFDRKEAEDNFMFVELKQQIKDLNSQLELSCETYEAKLADRDLSNKELETRMEDLKINHEKQIREQDKKWRACLDRRLLEAENKYKEEIDELSKEWQNERKQKATITAEHLEAQELEHSSRLAVAAMESGASSSELLRKQVTSLTKQLEDTKLQHKHEMSELQKFLAVKKHSKDRKNELSIEDCTEMEYLRNILFEYMMGKEPVIMAKVLSAIVKFDPEQTSKILQKEEQKISLLRKVSSLMPKE